MIELTCGICCDLVDDNWRRSKKRRK